MPEESLLSRWLHEQHGVAHTSVARFEGFSPHDIAKAVSRGEMSRVRRSWLVSGDCDDARRAAASVSGRVTCVSAAKRLGLFTPDHSDIHIAVPRTASRLDTTGLRTHTATAPIPLARSVTEEPILNVLFHTARCALPADALAVWESALKHRLVDPALLQRVRWRSTRAAEFARVASHLSDSGVETRFLILMRSVGVRVRQQVWIDGHPLDGLIGERLAIQIDGFAHHSSARDRRRDLRADGRLALRGYTVLRFDYYQVLFESAQVIDTVLTAIAQGLQLPDRG